MAAVVVGPVRPDPPATGSPLVPLGPVVVIGVLSDITRLAFLELRTFNTEVPTVSSGVVMVTARPLSNAVTWII